MATAGCEASRTSATGDVSANEDAVKAAASSECTATRDACRAQATPIVDTIKAACTPVHAACARPTFHHAVLTLPLAAGFGGKMGAGGAGGAGGAMGASGAGGSAGTGTGGSTQTCADARTACSLAIAAAKPQLKALGASCEMSIRAACMVTRRDDAGATVPPTPAEGDAGAMTPTGAGGASPAAPDGGAMATTCWGAVQGCRAELSRIRTMPPMECDAVKTACAGSEPMVGASDPCTTAVTACRGAVETAVTAAHESCGASICAACRRH